MTEPMTYDVAFKPSVEKDLKRVPKQVVARILERIEALAINPLPPGCAKLSGAERLYRIRVGQYRVVYGIDSEARVVTVHYVRHRREVYRRIG
jgi:mRNA interferase RelE/StbE